MKRLLILFVIVINCTLVATAQDDTATKEMKRFQEAVASADTLKIRSLQKEYLANIEFYSKGASKDEGAYLFYNLMSGLSHLSIAECKEAIPFYTIAYEGYSKQRSHTSEEEKSLSELTGSLGICHAYSQNPREAVHYASLSVKHAKKSKMDRQVTLSKFWLVQVYYQIGQYPKAYKTIRQIKTKVEYNHSYESFPLVYINILNEMLQLAICNNHVLKVGEYYEDLKYILKKFPKSRLLNLNLRQFLAKYYIYCPQYDKFEEVFYQLVNTSNLTTEQQLDLLYVISENLYQKNNTTQAYSFLDHIKNSTRYSSNPEMAQWVEQRIKYLDNWVYNNVSYAQQCIKEGRIEDAIYWYDAILEHIEKTKGKKADYAEILNLKARGLCDSGKYTEAIKPITEALDIIKIYSSDDLYAIIRTYYTLLTLCDKLEEKDKKNSIAKDAANYIIANYNKIKNDNNTVQTAQNVIRHLIRIYVSRGEDAARSDSYAECISWYKAAVELMQYSSISGYHDIYYPNGNGLLIEYLIEASYNNDIHTFHTIVDEYFANTELCYNSYVSDKIYSLDETRKIILKSYERLALSYRLGDGANYILDKTMKYAISHNIESSIHYEDISNKYLQIKSYCEALENDIKSLQRIIYVDGYKSAAAFECFTKINNTYHAISAFKQRAIEGKDVHPNGHYHSYANDCKLYTTWYSAQQELAQIYGDDYLNSLWGLDATISWHYIMMIDKIYLHILYNRMSEMENMYNILYDHAGVIQSTPYMIPIAQTLSEKGYYKYAISILSQLKVAAEEEQSFSILEEVNQEIASVAYAYNKFIEAKSSLSTLEKLINNFISLHQTNGYVFWYDTQTIVSSLFILAHCNIIIDGRDTNDLSKVIEYIVSNNIMGTNGKQLDNYDIASNFAKLSAISFHYNTKERYLLEAIRRSPDEFCRNIYIVDLANLHNQYGQYDKSEELLSTKVLHQMNEDYLVVEWANSTHLVRSWMSDVLKCTTLNAIWKKDSSKAKVESKKRLDTIIKMYLQKSQMLTNSSRAALWDYSFGSTLQWFSMVDLLNDRDATVSYDAALFHKNILLTQHAMIDKNIRACNDSELKVAHNEYLVAVRNQTDSIEMLESRMMQLYAKHPEFVDTYKPLSWRDVQTRLSKKDVAIEFALTEKNATSPAMFVALLLQHNAQNPIVAPLCNYDDLKNLIDKYTDSKTGYANIYDIPDNSLYQLLWSPLQDYLKGVKNIYFAPYDLLNNINFSAIRFEDTKKRIGDMYSLHRLSSTAKLCESASDNTYKKMVAFGGIDYNNYDSLVNTTQSVHKSSNSDDSYSDVRGLVEEWNTLDKTKPEVQHIQSALTKSDIAIQVHTDTNASEEQFKKLSGDSVNIIHLATHGYYFKANDAKKMLFFNNPNREIPMNIDSGARSGLILSGGNIAWKGETHAGREDGVLTAKEILGMDLSSADLVVLSACQTALGDIRNDGIYGMQRNIKMAGARSMIMSLWQVSDEATERMMTAFYCNLSHGNSKKQAFNKAIAKVRKAYQKKFQKGKDSQKHRDIGSTARDDSSYYWAAFVMLD